MRKKIVFLLLSIILTVMLLGCNAPIIGYDTYFNNFSSTQPYATATATLKLADYEDFAERGVYVSSYDENSNIYIIKEELVINQTDYAIHGFCTQDKVLIAPRYVSVLSISGDYAIVTKMVASGDSTDLRIGLVKIRGNNQGREYGFSYNYAIGITQYSFLNNRYLSILGDKNTKNDKSGNTFSYATIYDYTSADGRELLEVGRLKNVNNYSKFQLHANNLVSINNNVIRFHLFDDIGGDGFYNVKDTYMPFSAEDNLGIFAQDNVSCSVYYIGNDWFVLSSIYDSTTKYDGFEMEKLGDDQKTPHYLTIRSVRYTAKQNKAFITDRVVLVANEYNESLIRELTNAVNFQEEYYTDSTGTKGVYFQPVVPMSSAVAKGYSIVYYNYYYSVDNVRHWGTSFSLYDQNANVVDIESLLMPLLFVDGIGLLNADPNFDLPPRDAQYYLSDKTVKSMASLKEKEGYDSAVAHSDMILTYRLDVNTYTTMLGAYDKKGNLAVPFRYYELTPFFGDYATGSMVDGEGENIIRRFYKINKNGGESEINNVYALKNGVYITVQKADKKDEKDKYGLYSNDGTMLIAENCENISVIDSYLTDGKFIKTTVVTIENGCGVIYKLG